MANDISKAKQLALSSFVILTFIGYSMNQRGEKPDNPVIPPSPPPTSQSTSSGTTQSTPSASPGQTTNAYKDGSYTGSVADAYYGNIQVQVIISSGKITDVKFLQHPQDNSNSVYINSQAMPYLKQEAIAAQSSRVDIVSGATDTSYAFVQSLAAALAKAH